MAAAAELGTGEDALLLALVAAQLALPRDAMVRVAALQGGGRTGAFDQVQRARRAHSTGLQAAHGGGSQAGAGRGVHERPIDQRPAAGEQPAALSGQQPRTGRADADLQVDSQRLGRDGTETGHPAHQLGTRTCGQRVPRRT